MLYMPDCEVAKGHMLEFEVGLLSQANQCSTRCRPSKTVATCGTFMRPWLVFLWCLQHPPCSIFCKTHMHLTRSCHEAEAEGA